MGTKQSGGYCGVSLSALSDSEREALLVMANNEGKYGSLSDDQLSQAFLLLAKESNESLNSSEQPSRAETSSL